MKIAALIVLILGANLYAQGLLPELQPLAKKHENDSANLEAQKSAAVARAIAAYIASLEAAEKAAAAAGQLAAVTALTQEREAAKSRTLPPNPTPGLSKDVQSARKSCVDAVTRVSADFDERQLRVNADYLRALAAIESRAPDNSELAKQVALEKANLAKDAGAATVKRLGGTRWTWRRSGGKGGDEISFRPDGTGQHTHSSFQFEGTGPKTVTLTLPTGEKATLTFNAAFSAFKGIDFDNKFTIEGEQK